MQHFENCKSEKIQCYGTYYAILRTIKKNPKLASEVVKFRYAFYCFERLFFHWLSARFFRCTAQHWVRKRDEYIIFFSSTAAAFCRKTEWDCLPVSYLLTSKKLLHCISSHRHSKQNKVTRPTHSSMPKKKPRKRSQFK